MRLLRERVGPEPMLMWDRGVNTLTWDVGFALQLTTALEAYGLTWMEEPFEPTDLDAFRRLKSRCSTPFSISQRPAGLSLRIAPAGEMWSVVTLSLSTASARAPEIGSTGAGSASMPSKYGGLRT